jgi:preprotein translocase subunit SecG
MILLAKVDGLHYLFMVPLTLLSVFLMLVILVQRGRGGGLTGALGGMGGQSAFGTKAGDLFTRITIVVAAIWVLLSMASLKVLNQQSARANMDPTLRGQPTTTSKSGDGRPGEVFPSATIPGKTAEQEPSPSTNAAPGSSTPTATPTGETGAKTPDTTKQ